jgi:hypothetical protein
MSFQIIKAEGDDIRSIGLSIVETQGQLQNEIMVHFPDNDTKEARRAKGAFCHTNLDYLTLDIRNGTNYKVVGIMFLEKEDLDQSVIVHECVHAAIRMLTVMRKLKLTNEEMLCQIVTELFDDIMSLPEIKDCLADKWENFKKNGS